MKGAAETAAAGGGPLDPGVEIPTGPFGMDDLGRRIRRRVGG